MTPDVIAILTNAAQAAGVSAQLLVSMCFYESSFKNIIRHQDGNHTSVGICQVQLPAAQDVDKDIRMVDLLNMEINAYVAATYLRQRIDKFNGRVWCGVSAYNKGVRNVECPRVDTHYSSKYTDKVRHIMKTKPWIRLKRKIQ